MTASHPEPDEVQTLYLKTDRVSQQHRGTAAGQITLLTNHLRVDPACDPRMPSHPPSERLVRSLSSPTKAALPVRARDAFCFSILFFGRSSFRNSACGHHT